MAVQNITGNLTTHGTVRGTLNTHGRLSGSLSVGGGTTDYNELENKPTYNGHIIEGELTSESLGIWQPKNFSTEEQNTGLKWIDGKDIYRAIIEFNTMYNNMTLSFNANVDSIIKLNGIVNDIDDYINIPYYHTGSYYIRVYYRKRTHDILFETTNEQSQYYDTGFIIIEYTKN